MLMMPPPLCPYSAEKFDVITVNSCTESGEKVTTARARPTPVFRAPSARMFVLPARPPLTNRLKPGVASSRPGPDLRFLHPHGRWRMVIARSSALRLFSGTSVIWRSEIVCDDGAGFRVDHRHCRRSPGRHRHGAPTCMVRFTVTGVAVSTLTRSIVAFLKPGSIHFDAILHRIQIGSR